MKHLKLFENFILDNQNKFQDLSEWLEDVAGDLSRSKEEVGRELGLMVEKIAEMLLNDPQRLNHLAKEISIKHIGRLNDLSKLGLLDDEETINTMGIDMNGYLKLYRGTFNLAEKEQELSEHYGIPIDSLALLGAVLWSVIGCLADRKIMDDFIKILGV